MMYMMTLHLEPSAQQALVRERLGAAIKTLGSWSNRMPDMWLLEPTRPMSAGQIRDHLRQFMGPRDAVFVARISRNWAGRNLGRGFPEWMGRRDFGAFTSPKESTEAEDA